MYNNKIVQYIAFFLLLVPLLDALNYFGIGISVLLKIGFVVSLLIYCFIFYKGKHFYEYMAIIFCSILYMLIFVYYAANGDFLAEMSGIIRLFYLPILLILYYCIKEDKNEFVKNSVVVNAALIYAVIILVSVIFNLGSSTFEDISSERLGFKGILNAANDVSIIIGIGAAIVLIDKFSIINGIKLAILIVAMAILSAKTPFILLLFMLLYKLILNIRNLKVIIAVCISVVVLGIYIANSNIVHNYKVHTEFIVDKYDVDSVSDLKDEPVILINEYILSGRIDLVKEIDEVYDESNSMEKAIGIGFMPYARSTEMDYFEIFYRTGIIGFIAYMSILIFGVVINMKDSNYVNKKLIIILLFLISFITGHVLMSTSVSLFVATLIASKEKYICEK